MTGGAATRYRVPGRPVGAVARAAVLAAALAASACTSLNPVYCDPDTPCRDFARPVCDLAHYRCEPDPLRVPCGEGGTCSDPQRPICYDGVCVGCDGDADCGFGSPVCSEVKLCVGCSAASDCDRFDNRPFCQEGSCAGCRDVSDCEADLVCDDEELLCRGCRAGGECASAVCDLELARCVPEDDVLYVATGGDDGGACSREDPCATVQRAVDIAEAPRNWISVGAGSFDGPVAIDGGVVRIAGASATDTTLTSSAADTPVVTVGPGSDLVVAELTLADAAGGNGLRCEVGQAEAVASVSVRSAAVSGNELAGLFADRCALALDAVSVVDNVADGIEFVHGTLEVVGSELSRNGGLGIMVPIIDPADAGTVAVRRSRVEDNGLAGMIIRFHDVEVSACSIRGNGGNGLTTDSADLTIENNFIVDNVGKGLSMSDLNGVNTGRYEFNTVASNGDADLFCSGGSVFAGSNNIVAGVISGECTLSYSIGPAPGDGEGNLGPVTPLFVDPAAGDYHLEPTSPGVDRGGPSAVTVDFDGDSRPQGAGSDMGADEVVR